MRYGFRIASFGLVAVFIGFLIGRQPSAAADYPATQPSDVESQIKQIELDRDNKLRGVQEQLDDARAQLSLSQTSDLQIRIDSLATEKLQIKQDAAKQIAAIQQIAVPAAGSQSSPSIAIDPRVTPQMIAGYRHDKESEFKSQIADLSLTVVVEHANRGRTDEFTQTSDQQMLRGIKDPVERQQLQDQFKQDRQRVEDARKELDDELSQARADLAAFDKMSDTDVAVVLTKGLQQQDAGSKGQGELTYDLDKPGPVTKFPNWHGPWKTCPLCGGTGHSYASQQKTEQDASPDIAQVAGTGMSATIKNAISYCEMCGGTGQVPDYGK